jgi:xanthine dehydrogenase YagS FAD-binding subunit
MAFKANVVIAGADGKTKTVSMDEFFVPASDDIAMETILKPKEIITEVIVPVPAKNTKSFYIKQVARESYDWSLGDVAVVMETSGDKCKTASIVLGAAAPTPHRSVKAEEAMVKNEINAANATAAAEAAMSVARPLSKNAYKVPMFKSIIKEAIVSVS